MPEPGDVHIGPDHLEVAADRGALAAILDARGRHREAQQTLRHVLSVLETVLGPDHYEVAATLDRLAASVQHTGDYEQAASLHERSLAIKRRILGPGHVDVAETASRLTACRASARAETPMSALDRNHPTALVKNPARDVAETSARLAACRAEVASRRRDERTG